MKVIINVSEKVRSSYENKKMEKYQLISKIAYGVGGMLGCTFSWMFVSTF